MNITWGDELLDTSGGLDILGIRATDQAVELALVNGITTVSQRARYQSTLCWALGEFLINHQSEGFVWDRLMNFLRRVEFVMLAATRLDQEVSGADASGGLGANRNRDLLRRLLSGQPVDFPEEGGAILGTYLGPCRAIGLLFDGDESVPYRLTPRGKEIWEIKRKRLKDSPLITAICNDSKFSLDLARKAVPEFSLGSLSTSAEETRCLSHALITPWDPGNELQRASVGDAYDGITGTIRWAKNMLAAQPNHAAGILAQNYERCTNGSSKDQIAFRWAEYEYRRRCHFALELLLAALTRSLRQSEARSITQIIAQWSSTNELSPYMGEIWPDSSAVWASSAMEGLSSIPDHLFAGTSIPTENLRQLPPDNQALAAVAIIMATSRQTRNMRMDGHVGQIPSAPGERAIEIVETANAEPFSMLLEQLLELTAISHLHTTLRKMGAGQKCSLRFFPDGPMLRSTGIEMYPGQSNDRLTNVLRILSDLGELRLSDGKFTTSHGASE